MPGRFLFECPDVEVLGPLLAIFGVPSDDRFLSCFESGAMARACFHLRMKRRVSGNPNRDGIAAPVRARARVDGF